MPAITITTDKRMLASYSAVQFGLLAENGVDAYFYAERVELNGNEYPDLPSKYWTQSEFHPDKPGYITLPGNLRGLKIYSRKMFQYPAVHTNTWLVDLRTVFSPNIDGSISWWIVGVENDLGFANLLFGIFEYIDANNVNQLHVFGGPAFAAADAVVDFAKPSDAFTNRHGYRIMHGRYVSMADIDGRPIAFLIQAEGVSPTVLNNNTPPYAVLITPKMASSGSGFTEIITDRSKPGKAIKVTQPIYRFRVTDGDPVIPLNLPLYNNGTFTRFIDTSISGAVNSQPIPVWGYSSRLLLFRSNQGGTLTIYAWTLGGWKVYDTVSVTANSLIKYVFGSDVLVAYVSYNPSATPATVDVAEVKLA